MPEIIEDEAGKKLKVMLVQRGLKQNSFAKKIGVSDNYLYSIVNGRRKMTATVALRAALELGVSSDTFLAKSYS